MVTQQIERHLAGIREEQVLYVSGWGRLKTMTGLVLGCSRKPGEPAEGTLTCRKEPSKRTDISKLPSHLAFPRKLPEAQFIRLS